ncbi:MAG: tetratricopeptide repeat protein [Bdellovibrio sp.]|nr:tetratricopeptide repeat protein [Bdellovibrio sp.]
MKYTNAESSFLTRMIFFSDFKGALTTDISTYLDRFTHSIQFLAITLKKPSKTRHFDFSLRDTSGPLLEKLADPQRAPYPIDMKPSSLSRAGLTILPAIFLAPISMLALSGCSTLFRKTDANPSTLDTPAILSPEKAPEKTETVDKDKAYATIDMRLQIMEAKLNSLNDKIDAAKSGLDTLTLNMKHRETPVLPAPSQGFGKKVSPPLAVNDPQVGFEDDDAIQDFRKALILFHAQKYPEAIVSLSEYISMNSDHPLAASAQYYLGESYFRQKEYRLARQEYRRVLDSYPASAHISDALRGLASCSDLLQDRSGSAMYWQMLNMGFPQSPAAALPLSAIEPSADTRENPKPSKDLASDHTSAMPATAPIGSPEHP